MVLRGAVTVTTYSQGCSMGRAAWLPPQPHDEGVRRARAGSRGWHAPSGSVPHAPCSTEQTVGEPALNQGLKAVFRSLGCSSSGHGILQNESNGK